MISQRCWASFQRLRGIFDNVENAIQTQINDQLQALVDIDHKTVKPESSLVLNDHYRPEADIQRSIRNLRRRRRDCSSTDECRTYRLNSPT